LRTSSGIQRSPTDKGKNNLMVGSKLKEVFQASKDNNEKN
jgi:hypothetical protein